MNLGNHSKLCFCKTKAKFPCQPLQILFFAVFMSLPIGEEGDVVELLSLKQEKKAD